MKFGHVSAYSFGKDFKGKMAKTDRLYTPGPGAYTPGSTNKTNPHWKIGTEARSKSASKYGIPGPGQYEINSTVGKAPKYTMSSKSGGIDMSKYMNSPGPGGYTPKYNYMYKNNGAYSMTARPNSSKSFSTPGPGNYNIRTDKSLEMPSYKFGTEKKDGLQSSLNKFTPGPGNYNFSDDVGNNTAPHFSFPKDPRGDRARPMTPGPGQYQQKTYMGKDGPKITMSARPMTSGSSKGFIPGPGQYNSSMANKVKSPSYKIGTAERGGGFKYLEENPGPAQYSPVENNASIRPKSPTWSMGTGQRSRMNLTDLGPGPGNYNVSKGLGEGPKYTLTGKNFYSGSRMANPGPGQYSSDNMSNLYKNPSWRIGTSTRDDNIKKVMKENFPGPGGYNYKSEKTTPAFRFGTEKRDWRLKTDTPGPGQYRIPCSMVDVPNFVRNTNGFEPTYRYV